MQSCALTALGQVALVLFTAYWLTFDPNAMISLAIGVDYAVSFLRESRLQQCFKEFGWHYHGFVIAPLATQLLKWCVVFLIQFALIALLVRNLATQRCKSVLNAATCLIVILIGLAHVSWLLRVGAQYVNTMLLDFTPLDAQ
ncbi:hypothetical protein AB1L42_17880 [Thalassoglobus sp. JC818]|uniref:hypothetical protein n=1 Tax=Thalassoglobus sp. JC818 TaxID=3232136 RepID=UPI00345B2DA2